MAASPLTAYPLLVYKFCALPLIPSYLQLTPYPLCLSYLQHNPYSLPPMPLLSITSPNQCVYKIVSLFFLPPTLMERIHKLNEMLVASPNDCFLLHAIGLEYVKTADLEKAIYYFQKVIDSDPDYVGTYYHLAKTLERVNKKPDAMRMYETGIDIASKVRDQHAKNELQMALEDLIDE